MAIDVNLEILKLCKSTKTLILLTTIVSCLTMGVLIVFLMLEMPTEYTCPVRVLASCTDLMDGESAELGE